VQFLLKRSAYNMRFLQYKDRLTGEELVIEANEERENYQKLKKARTAARKFSNFVRLTGHDVKLKHITLTQAVEGFTPRYLHSFLTGLKKKYSYFAYFWTSEIQEERLEATGDAVLHWHLIIAIPYEDDCDQAVIEKLWKRGFVWVSSVNGSGVLKYILKYITKDGEYFKEKGARKYGGCRIPSVFSLTLHQLRKALQQVQYDFSALEAWVWSGGRGFLEVIDSVTKHSSRIKMIDVSFNSQYELVWEFYSDVKEPF
jgi:hypothetical protein